MAKVRWIGFDMDECIGSVMPLYSFLLGGMKHGKTPRDKLLITRRIADAIIESEIIGLTWLVRPVMLDVLRRIYRAYKRRAIEGAFIYSNNGSPELVEFMMYLCNAFMWRLFSDKSRPWIFCACMHHGSPLRPKGSLVKNFAEIRNCLTAYGKPLPTSTEDLLFFDDLKHVLADEIPNYVQVPAYINHTSVHTLVEVLGFLENIVGSTEWEKIVAQAIKNQEEDMKAHDNIYVMKPQDSSGRTADAAVFLNALDRFLGRRGGGVSRRQRCRRAARTRKNRALK